MEDLIKLIQKRSSQALGAKTASTGSSSSTSTSSSSTSTPGASSSSSGLLATIRGGIDTEEGVANSGSMKVLRELQPASSLCPMSSQLKGKWETLSAVVDSGATITAIHPRVGKAYKIQEGEAAQRGTEYEIADGSSTPNLGEKEMAVMTREGTLRGYRAQVAEVSSPLESVRQLLASKHCVLFGLGPNEQDHLIINKVTGEINKLRDDGVNYLHDMLIVPPEEVEEIQDALNDGQSPFGGQA